MPKRYKASYGLKSRVLRKKWYKNGKMNPRMIEKDSPKQFDSKETNDTYTYNDVSRLLLENSPNLLELVDHNLFPAFNKNHRLEEKDNALLCYPSCQFSTPIPLHIANNQHVTDDICYRRPMKQDVYTKLLATTRTTYQRLIKNKLVLDREEKGIYHSAVHNMAERVNLEPDSLITTSYDCYFTNGNLAILPDTQSVVQAYGNDLQTIGIYQFHHDNIIEFNCLNRSSMLEQKENSTIYEILPFKMNEERNLFLTRCRNTIKLHQRHFDQRIKTLTSINNDVPVCSMGQCMRNLNTLLVTTIENNIYNYDITTQYANSIELYKLPDSNNSISWNSIISYDESKFIYINQKDLYLIDLRTKSDQWLKSIVEQDRYKCDHLTSLKKSAYDNLIYVASSHKLYCMDLRYICEKETTNVTSNICQWTHHCEYAPLMMSTYQLDNSEYIALSSSLAGDLCICELKCQRDAAVSDGLSTKEDVKLTTNYTASCIAYQPPTIREAYEHARSSGICFDARTNLDSRLRCSTTGLTFHRLKMKNNDNQDLLLYSNSQGDIFAHCLQSDIKHNITNSRTNEASNDIMSKFNNHIVANYEPILNYTYIFQFGEGVRKIWDSDSSDSSSISISSIQDWQTYLDKKKDTLNELHCYQDLLVKDILTVWDFVDEGSEHSTRKETNCVSNGEDLNKHDISEPNYVLEMKCDDKVKRWLDTYYENNPETSIDDLSQSTCLESSQQETNLNMGNSLVESVSQQNSPVKKVASPIFSSQPIKKVSKKLKKSVKGF